MNKRYKSIKAVLAAGAGVLVIPMFLAQPASAAATLATCGKGVTGEMVKIQSAIMKAIQACVDGYNADQVKPETPQYAKAAPKCEAGLGKAIGLSNGSTMAKEKAKLDSFVGKSCTDVTLALLGHLPPGTFGDIWSRSIAMAALDSAYQEMNAANENSIKGIGEMGGLYGSTATGCPTCAKLTVPPCIEHACAYLSGAGSGFNDTSESGINIPLGGGLQVLNGVSTFKLCKFGDINPASDYLLGGSIQRGIQPALIPGVGHACVTTLGDEGYVNCGGSSPAISYHTCQDSNTSGSAGSTDPKNTAGACQAAISPDVCSSPTETDEVNGGVAGGACIKYVKGSGAKGVAYVNNGQELSVCQTGQEGPDGLPCTADDTFTPSTPGVNGLTTGTADTVVLNLGVPPGSGSLTNGPVTGAPFSCADIDSSNLSGGTIAGAFPTTTTTTGSATILGDQAVTFQLQCQ